MSEKEYCGLDYGDKVLVSVDSWFMAPDGQTYPAVYGTLKANCKSFIKVGSATIPLGRITSIIETDVCSDAPFMQQVENKVIYPGTQSRTSKNIELVNTPSRIYFADK